MLASILRRAVNKEASDIHLTLDLPPVFRINGNLFKEGDPALTAEDLAGFFNEIAASESRDEYQRRGSCDFSCALPSIGRFRVHIFCQQGSYALALRVIRARIPTLEELHCSAAVTHLSRLQQGLVLVTGPAGSGKSTTLAAILNQINRERNCHVITLEDPLEYLHSHQRAMIHQREISRDAPSFAEALRGALRQDPDVLMVGEMRDSETAAIAIKAAETGHLVLSTLHTVSAYQAVERVIDYFPPEQQRQIRGQLAGTLQGVIAQQLILRMDSGRVAAQEILIGTPAVRNLIRDGHTHQLLSLMQTGAKYGMKTMESALAELCQQGLIGSAEVEKWSAGHQIGQLD